MRLLLVEDSADLANATAEYLRDEGLNVQTALSGREALEIAPAFIPDLVLCDLSLPDMEGLEVVRVLRSRPPTSNTYIVILTARLASEVTRALGVDAVISKPITADAIRTLVHELGQRRESADRSNR